MAKARILIAKPGLDGHDRGAKFIAHLLRDNGYEVIYTGIRNTPEEIVAAAIQEDVNMIGLSLLSGAHKVLFKRVTDLLKQQKADDVLVIGGGTIPQKDIPVLESMGVRAIFTPGASAETILRTVARLLGESPRNQEGI